MFLLPLQQSRIEAREVGAVAGVFRAARQRLHRDVEFTALDMQARRHHRQAELRRRQLQTFLQHQHRIRRQPRINQHTGQRLPCRVVGRINLQRRFKCGTRFRHSPLLQGRCAAGILRLCPLSRCLLAQPFVDSGRWRRDSCGCN